MSNRKNYYFEQQVTESELDAGFNNAEVAERAIMADQNLVGITQGAVVTEAAIPDLTVDVSGPAVLYDQLGRRIFWSPAQSVDVSVDEDGNPTAVAVGGNEKTLTIFAEFDRTLSDARVDGNGAAVFFDSAESFKLNVVQSVEAPLGTSVAPALRADQLALCDIVIVNAQATVLDADIDLTGRRQDMFVLTGSPNSERAGTQLEALQAFQDQVNAFITTGASALAYAGGGAWKDGTTNPATTIEAQLDKVITDLAADAGAARIGAGAGPAWKDGTAVVAASIEGRLDQLITDLVADAGAARIGAGTGPAWHDGTPIAAASVEGRLDQITTDLVANAGADRIGMAAGTSLIVAGQSVQQGLAALDGQAKNVRREDLAFFPGTTIDLPTSFGAGVNVWAPAVASDAPFMVANEDSETLLVEIPLRVGDTLTDLRVMGSNTTTQLILSVAQMTGIAAPVALVTDITGALASTWAGTGISASALNHVVVADQKLYAMLYTDAAAGNVRVYRVQFEYIPGSY